MRKQTPLHAVAPERVRQIYNEKFKSDEIDESVCELISALVDDLVDNVVNWSVAVAEAKGSKVLESQDVKFICEQEWGINIKDQ